MKTIVMLIAVLLVTDVMAHGGGLDANGCHNDRKNGGYHCHDARAAPAPAPKSELLSNAGGTVYYANCKAARDAGAAPVKRGDAGYGSHLDRDNDGVACE